MSDTVAVDSTQAVDPGDSSSRFGQIVRGSGWVFTGIFFLVFFTLLKLPDDRIGGWLDGKIQEKLRPLGIRYSAQKTRLKFGFGVSYVLENATVDIPPASQFYFDKITLSPSFLALLTLKAGADARLEAGKSTADLSARFGKSSQSVSFRLKDVNLGSFGAVPGATQAPPLDLFNPNPMSIISSIKKSGTVNGSGAFSGDFQIPNTLDGDVHLDISKLVIEQQSLAGFGLPRMSVSEGKIEVATDKGKLAFKNVKLGKTGDDLRATLTGDMVLGKSWDTSLLNGKVNFSLSEVVTKALVLVDALLAPGKQSDGSYTYTLAGMPSSPVATPVGGGK